jgi:hypothetical protein
MIVFEVPRDVGPKVIDVHVCDQRPYPAFHHKVIVNRDVEVSEWM